MLDASFSGQRAETRLGTLALRGPVNGNGASGLVMLRPEQLDVRAVADAEPGDGLGGRVELCRYYGHDALLHIRAEEGAGTELLLARVDGEQALPVGTRVRVLAHGPATALG